MDLAASSAAGAGEESRLPSGNSRLSFDIIVEHQNVADQQQGATTSGGTQTTLVNWTVLMKYVNLNLVRNMFAQHATELIVLSVIIIYLVYYFSRISKRPKLVGSTSSKFVKMIRENFRDSLERRFSPLIYFWGTNPQTALFGYLQGQTSNHEVPRNKFKRQYLFVSDLQYLASNIDLSEHYEQQKQHQKHKLSSQRLSSESPESLNQSSQVVEISNTNKRQFRLETTSNQQQLDACQLLMASSQHQTAALNQNQNNNNQEGTSLLSQNIRLAMSNKQAPEATANKLESGRIELSEVEQKPSPSPSHKQPPIEESSQPAATAAAAAAAATALLKSLTRTASSDSSDSSAMGSSSDSGVFATGANSSSSSSSSHSGSSLTIDIESTDKQQQQQRHTSDRPCSCAALYELELQSFDDTPPPLSSDKKNHDNDDEYLNFSPSKISQKQQQQQQKQESEVLRREQLEFGQCALDWYLESHKHYHQNNKVALISAGMTTGSDKKYVTDTVQTLDKLGYEVCVFIRRGVGGLKLSSAKFFSPSKWRDFEAAILSIKKQRPGARLVAIGFSFGSIELCRYLSMSGASSLVDSALLISCPFDPEAGGRNMRKRALNRKIDAYLAKNLGKQLYQALADGGACDSANQMETSDSHIITQVTSKVNLSNQIPNKNNIKQQQQQIHFINYNGSAIDLSCLPKIKSLVDFEDNYNRVLQNYPSSDAYADDSRLSELLTNIQTPTLCLSSEDDFMAPMKLLPIKQIEANKNLCMILTKRGGHMAFIDGILWPKRPYFAQRIIEKYMGLDVACDGSLKVSSNNRSKAAAATMLLTTTTCTTTTTTSTTLANGAGGGSGDVSPLGISRKRPALLKSLSLSRDEPRHLVKSNVVVVAAADGLPTDSSSTSHFYHHRHHRHDHHHHHYLRQQQQHELELEQQRRQQQQQLHLEQHQQHHHLQHHHLHLDHNHKHQDHRHHQHLHLQAHQNHLLLQRPQVMQQPPPPQQQQQMKPTSHQHYYSIAAYCADS